MKKRRLSIRFGYIVQRKERKTFCSRFVAMMPIAGVAVVKVSRKKTFQGLRGKWYFVTKIVLTYCEKKLL